MTGQSGAVAARSFHPDPADPTPRPHRGDQLHIGGGIRPELIGSQQAARVIHHRPNMEIPMCVHPANHTHPTGPNLLCHVLAFRRLPKIPSPRTRAERLDRTLGLEEHSKWRSRSSYQVTPLPGSGFLAGARSTDRGKGTKGQFSRESDPAPTGNPISMSVFAQGPRVG